MKHVICLLLLLLSGFGWAQTDFNNYKPLKSAGPVPFDFATPTRDKIRSAQKDHLKELSGKEKEIFIEEVNYAIDELLKSGQVTFGDPVSNYIQSIGERLVKDDPNLSGKLRFYTYNVNEANAFSTDQGMVFVTTGLIAQMTNEAQLAFVLAHEIIHYREKHVLDLFDYSTSNEKFSYSEKVRLFSKYSRDNEFEADNKAVALVYAAGYTPSEINMTFDVLLYSYLPFEELVFDKEYFNNDWMFVPQKAFDAERSDISARSNYNDRLNSHPNVAKRKEELDKEIAKFTDWGKVYNYSDTTFAEVRNICRYEFILNDIYEGNSTDALYAIYIMEKQFPNSRFLGNCKSQIWLDLMKYEKKDQFSYYDSEYYYGGGYQGYSGYEGNISVLARFMNRLPKEGKISMGLRAIRDNFMRDTTDSFARELWEKAIEFSAYNQTFDDVSFSKLTFKHAIAKIEKEKREADSLKAIESKQEYKWNKYETIKNQKSGFDVQSGIDSSKFYLYGISDLMNDSIFKSRLEHYTLKMKEEENKEDELFEMTDEELDDYYTEEYETKLHIDLDTVLMINPVVYEKAGYRTIDYKKSDELEKRFLNAMSTISSSQGITVKQLDRSDQKNLTSEDYNNLSQLMRSMKKRAEERGINSFMLDGEELKMLREKYGSNHVMLMSLEHQYAPNIYLGNGILYTVLFPVGLVYFPVTLLAGHTTDLQVYVMDLKTGELVIDQGYYANEPASKKFLELRFDALFNQLKQAK